MGDDRRDLLHAQFVATLALQGTVHGLVGRLDLETGSVYGADGGEEGGDDGKDLHIDLISRDGCRSVEADGSMDRGSCVSCIRRDSNDDDDDDVMSWSTACSDATPMSELESASAVIPPSGCKYLRNQIPPAQSSNLQFRATFLATSKV